MRKKLLTINYIIIMSSAFFTFVLLGKYFSWPPQIKAFPTPLFIFICAHVLRRFLENGHKRIINNVLKTVNFSSNNFSLIAHGSCTSIHVDPIKGEFLIIDCKSFGRPKVRGYNFEQWGGYEIDNNVAKITFKFNDFEFPAFSIYAKSRPDAKEFCNKLDIMCSPSYSPKDERSFYKHVQQSLATA
ncbi:hypothetical protein RCM87_22910 [Escherichia marmotae]|uniref:hypothetical protein n=1 Tax=Escherichia TaxID=561 RepID=UPI001F543220|nr:MULTISPECIES: hypothetical protein [Escherichia]MEC9799439.1 hypothetical protein [Escherichia marmotae]MEC9865730.1 hypothetical protein [Escherichia coli]MED0060671.1 hypothetical protein [Escherichia marmotae]MED0221206.1 hypothetical protein [Escherichia coli]MED8893936.1 hypothetical protein [Escherichia marmotae]